MIFSIDKKDKNAPAIITDGGVTVSYGQLAERAREIAAMAEGRSLVFQLCRNVPESVEGYVGMLSGNIVPLLLDANIEQLALDKLIKTYRPNYFWLPEDVSEKVSGEKIGSVGSYVMIKTDSDKCEINDALALLLATSGSTGSPKLVRQSRKNIEANAESIKEYLHLDESERPITTLPMQYTYGLSIINSHLYAGACVLMTTAAVVEKRFWEFFTSAKATSFGGVPSTYEILKRIHFFTLELPSLKSMTQAGGKLPTTLQEIFGKWAVEHGVEFFVMYGQTEATARMGYLPPNKCLEKTGSMGRAIPGGSFALIGTDGEKINAADTVGELVYSGDNVTLGYAQQREDLAKGDERCGVLQTGDMAKRDRDGYYYIVGRKKRFVKLFGIRVSLDECEQLLDNKFPEVDFACIGNDEKLKIFATDSDTAAAAPKWIADVLHMSSRAFEGIFIPQIPKSDSGKTMYIALEKEDTNG